VTQPIVLVESSGVAALRRRVGPVAWCALEVLVARALPDGDGLVVDTSVRLVAVELAVAKNTAQRALKTLRSGGVIETVQGRNTGGRFAATTYRIHLPVDMLQPDPSKPQSSRKSRRAQAGPVGQAGQQLVLVPST
jgi:hypothetical protein